MNTKTITLKRITDFKSIGTFADFKNINNLPSCLDGSIGNYCFLNPNDEILYIGKATEGKPKGKTEKLPKFSGLRKRIGDYIKMNNNVSKKIRQYRNNPLNNWNKVEIKILISEGENLSLKKAAAAGLEIYLIGECEPKLNIRR